MMQSNEQPEPGASLVSVVRQFEVLLEEERQALLSLNREGIEAAAVRKEELVSLLASEALPRATPSEVELVAGLSEKLKHNHLLLSHAKSAVAGVLALVGETPGAGYQPQEAKGPSGLRLSVKG
jgi:hypothetical protein